MCPTVERDFSADSSTCSLTPQRFPNPGVFKGGEQQSRELNLLGGLGKRMVNALRSLGRLDLFYSQVPNKRGVRING